MNKKLQRFANQMQIELDNNNHKGSILDWKGISDKIADLEYHKAKMLLAIRTGNKFAIKEYIADCGNILLSIGNELGLYEEESINTGMASEVVNTVFNIVQVKDQKIGKLTENLK